MKKDPILVVLGIDKEKKPHAAQFAVVDEAAVRKAAALMEFDFAHARTDEARKLASSLVEGRIFDTGRGLVPFVKPDLYEKLRKLVEIDDKNQAALVAAAPPLATWNDIKVGSTVLFEDTDNGGWWPCIVTNVQNGSGPITIRWRDFPKFKPFKTNRFAVALPGTSN